jgi:hypothetical protein
MGEIFGTHWGEERIVYNVLLVEPEIKRSLGSHGREYVYESNGSDRNRMEWRRLDTLSQENGGLL